MSDMVQKTSTGDVTTVLSYLKSVTITHTAAATVDIRKGGSSGTVILTVGCVADGTGEWHAGDPRGVACPGGIHATVSAGKASVEFA